MLYHRFGLVNFSFLPSVQSFILGVGVAFPLVLFTGSYQAVLHGFTGFFVIAFWMGYIILGVGHGLGRRRFAKTIDTFA